MIKKICIIGSGVMGHGIALVCAQSGFMVTMEDVNEEFLHSGMDKIRVFLKGSLERNKITQIDVDNTLSRLKTSTDLSKAAADADVVIEAIVEDMTIKQATFKQLDQICPQSTIFTSNTSYQSITELAAVTKRQDRFLGMHWFNPPQLMRGIEVIRTEKTSRDALNTIVDLCYKLGKEPAICIDSPSFIANRLLQVWRNQAFNIYDEGVTSFQNIDIALKTACGFRMGPFELGDLTGLDITLAGSETMYREMGRDIFKPARCNIMKVRAGDYGRKTGRGFYEYNIEN